MYINIFKYEYLIPSKHRSFVRGNLLNQSPFVYVKIGFIDWLDVNPGQMNFPSFQRDMYNSQVHPLK